MKFRIIFVLLPVLWTLCGSPAGGLRAQETDTETHQATVTAADAAANEAASKASESNANEDESRLRELGTAPAESGETKAGVPSAPGAEATPAVEAGGASAAEKATGKHRKEHASELVMMRDDAVVEADQVVSQVVAIMGNVTVLGKSEEGAVAVLGDTRVEGEVNDDTVAVLGNVTVNGKVDGDAVAVMGGVILGPNADIKGDVVTVGGGLKKAPGAKVHGEIHQVSIVRGAPDISPLRRWIIDVLMTGRLLGFGSESAWAWILALTLMTFYVLLAAIFGAPAVKCAETFEQRPGRTFLAALLGMIAMPLLAIPLAITVVGPFLLAILGFCGAIMGKVVFLVWLGRRITKPLGVRVPVVSALIGGGLLLVCYMIPVVAIVMWKLSGFLGFGAVVYTVLLALRRDRAAVGPKSGGSAAGGVVGGGAPVGGPPAGPSVTNVAGATSVETPAAGAVATEPGTGPASDQGAVAYGLRVVPEGQAMSVGAGEPPPIPEMARAEVPPPPPVPVAPRAAGPDLSHAASTLERAGFWWRLAASALNTVLVGVIMHFVNSDWFMVLYAAYCVVFWALKGTTVGGVVCGLKVVRLDDRPVDWTVAIVRALGGFLSLFAAGLGFAWVSFDEQRQSWHDKIAGTVIVRVPKGVSLI